ncbi:thiol reductant ABC exporter subunit CydD [Oceanicaulis sp. LC35]|uniref:thiol reductant ABC exporter subunit CydD n=1 Tax=Oceanicaulis sp. LC35 TaxID=3349635 RepID=UPI003F851977
MNNTDLSAGDMKAAQKARKARLAACLKAWGAPASALTRLSTTFGAAQYAVFVGFAWGAAWAVSALVNSQPVWPGLCLALVSATLRAVFQALETRTGVLASLKVRSTVRSVAARQLVERGPSYVERSDSGETASSLIDAVDKLDGYFGRYRPLMGVVMAGPLIIMAAAFSASYVVGLIFLVTAPLLILFMALVGAGAAAASKDQLTTLQRLAGRFNDRLRALETLNAFNAADREAEGLAAASDDFRRRTMKVLAMAFLSSGVLEFFAAVSVAGSAIYIGFALLGELPFDPGETITLRTGLFCLILAPEFYMPLRRLSAAYHDRADAEAGAEALAPLFDGPEKAEKATLAQQAELADKAGQSAPVAPALHSAPSLTFEQVGSVYSDGRRGLAPLSFDAPAGQITALWGPSGVGKSTALKLLLGYAPLTEGQILVDGQAMTAPLIGQAAWISQRPHVFFGDLVENISLYDDALPRERIIRAAETAGVMDFAAGLPDGLETKVGENGYGLSGGQAQRVALARAWAVDMKLVLLDEPTAHLDGEAEARFLDALKRISAGRTVLIATHSPAVRALADHVIELAPEDAA